MIEDTGTLFAGLNLFSNRKQIVKILRLFLVTAVVVFSLNGCTSRHSSNELGSSPSTLHSPSPTSKDRPVNSLKAKKQVQQLLEVNPPSQNYSDESETPLNAAGSIKSQTKPHLRPAKKADKVNGAFGKIVRIYQPLKAQGTVEDGDALIYFTPENVAPGNSEVALLAKHCSPLFAVAGILWAGDRISIRFKEYTTSNFRDQKVVIPTFSAEERNNLFKKYLQLTEFRKLESICRNTKYLDQQGDQQ